MHGVGGGGDLLDILLHAFGIASGGVLLEEAEEASDRHQRGFEVVTDGVGEAFEFGILRFQRDVFGLQLPH